MAKQTKLFARVVKERYMPVDFTLQEMRAIPGSATTRIREHEDYMLTITCRLEHKSQLPVYQELIAKAIKREHGSITSITFLTPAEAEEYQKHNLLRS